MAIFPRKKVTERLPGSASSQGEKDNTFLLQIRAIAAHPLCIDSAFDFAQPKNGRKCSKFVIVADQSGVSLLFWVWRGVVNAGKRGNLLFGGALSGISANLVLACPFTGKKINQPCHCAVSSHWKISWFDRKTAHRDQKRWASNYFYTKLAQTHTYTCVRGTNNNVTRASSADACHETKTSTKEKKRNKWTNWGCWWIREVPHTHNI